MFSQGANDRPPSSERWKDVEAERLRKLGKPDLAEELTRVHRSGRDVEAEAAVLAEKRARDAAAEEERRKQARVEHAMDEMFPGRRSRRG